MAQGRAGDPMGPWDRRKGVLTAAGLHALADLANAIHKGSGGLVDVAVARRFLIRVFAQPAPQRPGCGERPAGGLGPAACRGSYGTAPGGRLQAPPVARRRFPPRALRGLLAAFISPDWRSRTALALDRRSCPSTIQDRKSVRGQRKSLETAISPNTPALRQAVIRKMTNCH